MEKFFAQIVPDFIQQSAVWAQTVAWIDANSTLVTVSLVFSVALLVASPFIIAWIAVRLPVDYFVGEERPDVMGQKLNPLLYWGFRIVKNIIGVILIIAGIAMLVLPGQGILTILIGVSLVQFPGKYQLERWLISQPAVLGSINWIRRKANVPELLAPDEQPKQPSGKV